METEGILFNASAFSIVDSWLSKGKEEDNIIKETEENVSREKSSARAGLGFKRKRPIMTVRN